MGSRYRPKPAAALAALVRELAYTVFSVCLAT